MLSVLQRWKTIDKLGDKKKEEEMKRGTIARARTHLKREEASKRPDTCITEHAANLTSIARSGCMHGCSARKRQREKYRSIRLTDHPKISIFVT